MKRAVLLAALLPLPAAAMSTSGMLAPPGPCDGASGTVLVDGTTRLASIGAALAFVTAPGHHTVEVCDGTWLLPLPLFVSGDVALVAPLGPELTVLDASGLLPGDPAVVLWSDGTAPAPSLEGFTVTGAPGDGVEVAAVYETRLTDVRVVGNGGAGVHATGAAATLVVADSFVADNSAGGVRVEGLGSLDLTGTEVSGNAADSGGGVALVAGGTLIGGEVRDNAADRGGGVYAGDALVAIGTVVEDNTAVENGGGVQGREVVLQGATVRGNESGLLGGGVDAETLTLAEGSRVEANVAGSCGGGVFAWTTVTGSGVETISLNDADTGGGVCLADGAVLADVVVSSNTAADGGGVWIPNTIGATLTGATLTGNRADRGAAVLVAEVDPGPVIDLAFDAGTRTVDLVGCTLSGNTATFEGGGLTVETGLVEAVDTTLASNAAATGGAAWIASGAGLTLQGGSVSGSTGHGVALAGDLFLSSSGVAWSANAPADLLVGTTSTGAPGDEFVCDELTGCTMRQSSPGGDVLAP